MPLVQETRLVENSGYFTQRDFTTSKENTGHNISPGHQAVLNLDHSNSETSIHGTNSINQKMHSSNSHLPHSNEGTSPLHLASMLHSLPLTSMMHSNIPQHHQDIMQGSYLLILKNIPHNITLRESYAIFALANGLRNIELVKRRKDSTSENFEFSIVAKFGSLPLVTHYASILSSKTDIFGPNFSCALYVEVIDETTNEHVHFEKPNFNVTHSHYQISAPIAPTTSAASMQHHQQQQRHHQQQQHQQQQQQQQQASPVSSTSGRPSLLPTRSRFSFNDPFSSETKQQVNDQQTKIQHNSSSALPHSRSNQESSSTDVGKSFLLMESDDINDSIWGSNVMPSSMNGFSSTPQPSTPILEWGTTNRKPSSSFFLPQTRSSTGQATVSQTIDVTPSLHGLAGSTPSSATISTPFNIMCQVSNSGQSSMPNVIGGSEIGSLQRKHNIYMNSTKQDQQQQQQQQPQQQMPLQEHSVSTSQTGTPQKNSQVRGGIGRNTHSSNGAQKNSISNPSSSTNVAGSTTISQADLSLLARVPPPANPADQNPPCNTLYVGNLPPDTTEQELRQLFSGQQGFRRLSFRNKNSNGNGHGPMCFVEFEDVSFATRALAELYGSQLPRASASNKGGIRLSFSKNPLGVRGPNNRRNGSNTSVNNSTGTSSGNTSGFNNYNYPTGFNKV
ncbi:hypothetical protein HG536_0D00690 [Torulaspora globosa]|uniref:RRM domain-containing protein n=1 Tax=Torulaspora globosa TaxID=48254 RepID=A0A7G3ZGB1_9SACH|nr:uncharacterized protein HG536_0D00690 [Torulaspora globosa]QLL32547.1 hypothetical protein HG536_0D00690 [Torulaspora globosa]